ncbi:MAG: hypothetical protein P0S94_01810 [Simkaniaceae bacterium]|nr:hypothetical protein [Simkaniaceae bacterium]
MGKKGIFNLVFTLFLILLIPTVILIERKNFRPKKEQYKLPQESEAIGRAYAQEGDKSFVVIVLSQEGDSFSLQNIDSIMNQKYPDFRVIFVNFGEDHTTLSDTKNYIDEQGLKHRVSFINSSDHSSADYYHIITACRDEEIIVQMDAKDWLASDFILEKLNETYEDSDVWLTYGQYLEYPSLEKGRIRSERTTKKTPTPWVFSRLKTFYAGLFKEVQQKENASGNPGDPSFLFPMLEMAKWHVRFIPEVLYVKSNTSVKSADNFTQSSDTKPKRRADCVLFSKDQPMKLQQCLGSIENYLHEVGLVSVIFESSPQNHTLYNQLQKQFPKVRFREISNDLKDILSFTLSPTFSTEEYVFMIPAHVTLLDEIFSSNCIDHLEKAKADAFYFETTPKAAKSIVSVPFSEGVHAWSLAQKGGACDPTRLTMVLQKKSDIRTSLESARFKSIDTFIRTLKHLDRHDKLGLFFEKAKASGV